MNTKKNVLFITSDQQRWDTIGCLNNKIQTPNLDRLCRDGICFTRGYTVNPTCTPTRVSLLTGEYPSYHGCYTIGTSLEEDYPTLPGKMSNKGVFTSLIGKAHFQSCAPGFETFESSPHANNHDFFRNWSGPFYGFDHVQLCIAHGDQKNAGSMHYGQWLEDNGINVKDYFGKGKYEDFHSWDLPDEYSNSSWVSLKTIESIDTAVREEKPFFIWSSFQNPHNPCVVSKPWADMYDRDEMPVYELEEGEWEGKPEFYQNMMETGNYGDDLELYVRNLGHCISNLPFMDREKKKEIMALYYGMISQMDHYIGKIIDHMEEIGLMDDTLIVFTSDHGDYMGNHGLWWKGLPVYDDVQKVPYIVRHPECSTPGMISDSIQSIIDITPTAMKYLDLDLPVGSQGVDQTQSWVDGAKEVRDWALVEFRPTESDFYQQTFINKKYKLVVYNNKELGELYDLENDPDFMKNLWNAKEYETIKSKLLQEMIFAEMQKEGIIKNRPVGA